MDLGRCVNLSLPLCIANGTEEWRGHSDWSGGIRMFSSSDGSYSRCESSVLAPFGRGTSAFSFALTLDSHRSKMRNNYIPVTRFRLLRRYSETLRRRPLRRRMDLHHHSHSLDCSFDSLDRFLLPLRHLFDHFRRFYRSDHLRS